MLSLQVKSIDLRMSTTDSIYTDHSLHSLPHRWRIRQIVRLLKQVCANPSSYADVGCGDGFVTSQIARELRPQRCVGYDFNPEVLELGKQCSPEISFRYWNFATESLAGEKYELVTCLETLEHVSDMKGAVKNLLSITERYLLVTVPVEIGLLGLAKFSAKTLLGREIFSIEHQGSRLDYLCSLVSGAPISHFRRHPENGHWKLHTGFDYRELNDIFRCEKISFHDYNRVWNRFYVIEQQN